MISRRVFLKRVAVGLAGIALPLTSINIISPKKLFASKDNKSNIR